MCCSRTTFGRIRGVVCVRTYLSEELGQNSGHGKRGKEISPYPYRLVHHAGYARSGMSRWRFTHVPMSSWEQEDCSICSTYGKEQPTKKGRTLRPSSKMLLSPPVPRTLLERVTWARPQGCAWFLPRGPKAQPRGPPCKTKGPAFTGLVPGENGGRVSSSFLSSPPRPPKTPTTSALGGVGVMRCPYRTACLLVARFARRPRQHSLRGLSSCSLRLPSTRFP